MILKPVLTLLVNIVYHTNMMPYIDIVLNMLPSDFFMSCLDSLLAYSARVFQALQLIVFVVFDAMD